MTRDLKENEVNGTNKKEISIKLYINPDKNDDGNLDCETQKGKICVGKTMLFNLLKLGISEEREDDEDGIIILDGSNKSPDEKKKSVYLDIMRALNKVISDKSESEESIESNENADILNDMSIEGNLTGVDYTYEELADYIDDVGLRNNRRDDMVVTANSEQPAIQTLSLSESSSSEEEDAAAEEDDNNTDDRSLENDSMADEETLQQSDEVISKKNKSNAIAINQNKFKCSENCKCECGNPNPVPKTFSDTNLIANDEAPSKKNPVKKSKSKKKKKKSNGITAPSGLPENNNADFNFFHSPLESSKPKSCSKPKRKKCKGKNKLLNVSQRVPTTTADPNEFNFQQTAVTSSTTANSVASTAVKGSRKKKRTANSKSKKQNSKRSSSNSVRAKSDNGKK